MLDTSDLLLSYPEDKLPHFELNEALQLFYCPIVDHIYYIIVSFSVTIKLCLFVQTFTFLPSYYNNSIKSLSVV